ncbi:hypothetical protein JW930_01965 [Candidatus Woesearchaeota archaeon]|nr:hypothetical protein [Candidatus Woesearchaeota archaeon]
MEKKKKATYMYFISIAWMILGMLLNYFKLGRDDYSSFGSVGNWLIYIGFVGLIIATVRAFISKKKLVDERMHFVAAKANRMTFLALVTAAFIIMIIDGIKPITMPYHLFMSYLICSILLIYFVVYRILLRFS